MRWHLHHILLYPHLSKHTHTVIKDSVLLGSFLSIAGNINSDAYQKPH